MNNKTALSQNIGDVFFAEAENTNIISGEYIEGVKLAIVNRAGWDEFVARDSDPYLAYGVRFAEYWAQLMEKEIAEGKALQKIALVTSEKADEEIGITGLLYNMALSGLVHNWKYGEELRKWHEGQSLHQGNAICDDNVAIQIPIISN